MKKGFARQAYEKFFCGLRSRFFHVHIFFEKIKQKLNDVESLENGKNCRLKTRFSLLGTYFILARTFRPFGWRSELSLLIHLSGLGA